MALKLTVMLTLVLSAAAAPADTSRFQFDFSKILGTAQAQETKGSVYTQDGSRASRTGLGRTTFGETSGRVGSIRPGDSIADINAIVNSGSSAFISAVGGASSSTWGRADTSATQSGVGAAEINSKSGTIDAFGNGAASLSSGRGGGGSSRSIVESLTKSFQNIFGSGASGKAMGETSGVGVGQVSINGRSQTEHNGVGGVSSAHAVASAGGTASNGQKANTFTEHQTISNDFMSASSSQSRASLAG